MNILITVFGHNGKELERTVPVGITNQSTDHNDHVFIYENLNKELYWAILKFDDAGFYFRNPDIAKNNSREELDQYYRDSLDTMWIASMTGAQRAEIKEKKKEEEERKPWTWKRFNFRF